MGRKHRTTIPNHKLTADLRTNELFEKYYSELNLMPKDEWMTFLNTLRADLPSTFRVTGFGDHCKELLNMLKNEYFNDILKHAEPEEGDEPVALTCLNWYPGGTAWQLSASKNTIRKNKNLKKLHQFLISETESGNTSRQEAVSMIPPLLLDIESHHRILDLCAAPGSKSAQLVELLHESHEKKDKPSKRKSIQYDRILADVPCSGDGTMRKNPQIWLSWKPGQGIGEHSIQTRILKRGLELLRDDGCGRLVYSTCSLNPVEDEAVVACLLKDAKGTVELVEPPEWLGPNGLFKARPGICDWCVMLKDGVMLRKYEDVPEKHRSSHKSSLFPPENVADMHLERCRRVFPHDQNTGGFFIAILKKVATLPWMKRLRNIDSETQSTEPKEIENKVEKPAEQKKVVKIGKMTYNRCENPYKFIDPIEDKLWLSIVDYYGICNKSSPSSQILYRPTDIPNCKRNNMYYTNQGIKDIVEANSDTGLQIINCGLQMFALCDDKQYQGYRLSQDGADVFHSRFKRNTKENPPREIVLREQSGQRADLELLLREEIPLMDNFHAKSKEQWETLSNGPLIIRYEPEMNSKSLPNLPVILTGWRGTKSMRHYLKVHERLHLCRLCGMELLDPIKMEQKPADDRNSPESKVPRLEETSIEAASS